MGSLKLMMICCFTLLSAMIFAEGRNATGETFPREISFEYEGKNYKLNLTGEATRKKFFVNVYNVAHYLEAGTVLGGNKFQSILNDDKAKALIFKWARTVEAAKVKDGYNESFKKVLSPSEYSQVQNEINQFLSFFNQEVKKGDEHSLRWLPGGNIEVMVNGSKVGNIANPAFAKALWSIWFGEKSVVDREKLVSQIN